MGGGGGDQQLPMSREGSGRERRGRGDERDWCPSVPPPPHAPTQLLLAYLPWGA